MLTPQQLSHCADDIIELYQKLDESIARDIARRIVKTGYLTDTADWQVRMLQESGKLQADIIADISKHSEMSAKAIKQLFEDAVITSTEYDMPIYAANGLNSLPLNLSPRAMQTLAAGYNKTNGNIQNLTRTTAVTSQTTFINACTLAEMQVESGAFDYNTAIRNAIKQVAGISTYVEYPSGHRDKLDVAVRRNIITGVGQTTGEICLGYAQDMGCDLMEITAHSGARPSHAVWQGRIVSLSGRSGYLSLSEIGYGTGAGFKGWNCRHDWFPYFEGVSSRAYNDKDLEALEAKDIEFPDGSLHTCYEAEQKQRAYERNIRVLKRKLAICDEAINNLTEEKIINKLKNDFRIQSVKLKSKEAELKNFIAKTGLQKDNARLQSYSFNKSVSQKAVAKSKKYYMQWSKEHNINTFIKTLADYYNVKYNNTVTYELLKTYVRSVDKGMLSPQVGFDLYKEYYTRVENELIGLSISSGITIKSQSKHFLERVFGTMSDPKHKNKPRSGVEINDIKHSLTNGTIKKHYIKNTAGEKVVDKQGISFVTDKCSVSVNPITGNLIQVSPKGG